MRAWQVLAMAAVVALAVPNRTDACGGFFEEWEEDPDLRRPVDLAGVQVLFVAGDEEVEVHIQVSYDGEAGGFAWIVPLEAVPEIELGADEIFFALADATEPVHAVSNTRNECPTCLPCPDNGIGDGDADGDGDTDRGGGDDRVDILDERVVGPYETVTLSSDDPNELSSWLVDNGYAVPDMARPIIAAYVRQGFVFVGLRLTKDASAGDVRPVVFRMSGLEMAPCLPVRLAPVAAVEEMPLHIWVAGDQRAVSTNYPEIVLNDLITYFGTEETYDELVARAVAEVGGRAFVAEYAASSDAARSTLDVDRFDTDRLGRFRDPIDFMNEMVDQGFAQSRIVLELLREHIPRPDTVPEDVDDAEFYECLECLDDYYYFDPDCDTCYEDHIAGQPFDPVAFAADLEEQIVVPMRALDAQLATRPVLTKLRSTMSPDDMIEDPLFGFRDDLPPIEPQPATRIDHCQGSIDPSDDYFEGTTPEGLRARWTGTLRGLWSSPAVLRATLRDGSGDELLVDNAEAIQEGAPWVDVPSRIRLRDDVPCECGRSDGLVPSDGGCSCAAAGRERTRGLPFAGLALLIASCVSLAFLRRR